MSNTLDAERVGGYICRERKKEMNKVEKANNFAYVHEMCIGVIIVRCCTAQDELLPVCMCACPRQVGCEKMHFIFYLLYRRLYVYVDINMHIYIYLFFIYKYETCVWTPNSFFGQ